MNSFVFNTSVATECGLCAATILQWFIDKHKKNKEHAWIPGGVGTLVEEMPWLTETTTRTGLFILMGAGLLERRQRPDRKGIAYEYAITQKAEAYHQRR